jgi:hypothetical protein
VAGCDRFHGLVGRARLGADPDRVSAAVVERQWSRSEPASSSEPLAFFAGRPAEWEARRDSTADTRRRKLSTGCTNRMAWLSKPASALEAKGRAGLDRATFSLVTTKRTPEKRQNVRASRRRGAFDHAGLTAGFRRAMRRPVLRVSARSRSVSTSRGFASRRSPVRSRYAPSPRPWSRLTCGDKSARARVLTRRAAALRPASGTRTRAPAPRHRLPP